MIRQVQGKHPFDFFMGSLHHVHTIPIDFDRAMYEQARDAAGGTDERLFEDYFDAQLEMLQALTPPVVGHFDLIRLLSDHRDAQFAGMDAVWAKMRRNLGFVASYGGVLELNAAGLRKGLAEPYPCLPICRVRFDLGFLSPSSHAAVTPLGGKPCVGRFAFGFFVFQTDGAFRSFLRWAEGLP